MQELDFLQTIQQFTPITLAEMDSVKLMNRVDTKFAFPANKLDSILRRIKDDYRVFEIEGTRTPSYRSLYYDDEAFSLFHDHHKGKMSRFKIRVREYVESNLHFLEIKHKFKGRTSKSRISAKGFQDDLDAQQIQFILGEMKEAKNLKASLWNSFNRITLVSVKNQERLTLDFNLTFEWKEEVQVFDKLIIAELKQEKVNRSTAFFKVMKELAIRPYRLSKYCIGAIEIHGTENLKYNRFKKKLLTLKKINDNVA